MTTTYYENTPQVLDFSRDLVAALKDAPTIQTDEFGNLSEADLASITDFNSTQLEIENDMVTNPGEKGYVVVSDPHAYLVLMRQTLELVLERAYYHLIDGMLKELMDHELQHAAAIKIVNEDACVYFGVRLLKLQLPSGSLLKSYVPFVGFNNVAINSDEFEFVAAAPDMLSDSDKLKIRSLGQRGIEDVAA